jgi:hypothetical protein
MDGSKYAAWIRLSPATCSEMFVKSTSLAEFSPKPRSIENRACRYNAIRTPIPETSGLRIAINAHEGSIIEVVQHVTP